MGLKIQIDADTLENKSSMFNHYFNLGLYKYALGIPVLIMLGMVSFRYYILKYEATFEEVKKFIDHSILRLMFTEINHRKIYNYFGNRYDMPISGIGGLGQTRVAFMLLGILIEVVMLQTLLDFTDLNQSLLPTLFWSGLYLISFILCWRLGSRLKNFAAKI